MILAGVAAAALGGAVAPPPVASVIPSAQSDYLLNCGGCHGVDGRSIDRLVPQLKDEVGAFRCSPEGRAYVARLPNVAFAPLDDRRLSELLNYVFSLDSHPYKRRGPPYTPAEVAALRRRPLAGAPLLAYRRELVDGFVKDCGANPALKQYGSPPRSRPRS